MWPRQKLGRLSTSGSFVFKLCLVFAAFGGVTVDEAIAQGVGQPTTDELQRQLQQRDALINDLMRRVETLERQAAGQPPPAAPAGRQAQPPAETAPGRRPVAPAARPAPSRPPGTASEEETLARALERTLVQQGGQLLPAFTYEVVPQMIYTHASQRTFGAAGVLLGPLSSRRDILEGDVILRAGLPFDTQIDFTLPFVSDWRETTFAGSTTSRNDTGIGDISIGLSKQVLYERGWIPDAIASVRYFAATGSAGFSPAGQVSGTGTGADALQGALTLIKRQDPLVFFGGPLYTHTFSARSGDVRFSNGDAIGVRAGTILAASPDTSLRFVFDTSFVGKSSINDTRIAGSDQVISFVQIGASSILAERVLLDFGFDIGVTRDSPDFRAILSMPIRF
jgi:hypothetical protein